MTQAALARATGVSERNIVRWENDKHSPRADHIAAIARATGKGTDFFLTEAESDDDEESDAVADLVRALRRVVREEGVRA